MEMFYLVGEPITKTDSNRDEFLFPAGQIKACQEVVAESASPELITDNLRWEYLAIIQSLKDMGVEFRIVFAHPDLIDGGLLNACVTGLGCKTMGFGPNFFAPAVAYPRDFCTVLPNILLLSDSAIKELKTNEKDGWELMISPYGEGGRALVQGNTMVVCEKLVIKDGVSTANDAEVRRLVSMGIRVGFSPSLLAARFSLSRQEIKSFSSNDHIDRGACLLKGKDGRLFFVVDPEIATVDWSKPSGQMPWTPRSTEETIAYLKKSLNPLGINVCWPQSITVPYALNMLQFPDGRVLMTGGDQAVSELVGSIVGKENVSETEIPIRLYPVWMYAGIRCLVSEAPMPIAKPMAPR